MLLVFILLFIILIIITCKIKITAIINNGKSNIYVSIFIFGKIRIYKDSIYNLSKKIRKIGGKRKSAWINNRKHILKIIQSLKFHAEELKIKVDICTTDPALTAYLTGILASAIGILIKVLRIRISYKNFYYKIKPIYTDQKVLNIKLKCIISQNLVHIIFILLRNVKDWRSERYGRKSSNRRAYGNCNE